MSSDYINFSINKNKKDNRSVSEFSCNVREIYHCWIVTSTLPTYTLISSKTLGGNIVAVLWFGPEIFGPEKQRYAAHAP